MIKYDVFISYSSIDKKTVEALTAYFEQFKIRCFVAYRDIPKGVAWAKAIIEGLEASRMMVVVFSENFNKSDQVDREIEIASEDRKPILTFRLSNADFIGAKKYYLKNLNWIDAFPNPKEQFAVLTENVGKLLDIKISEETVWNSVAADRKVKMNSLSMEVKVKFMTDADCKIFIDNEERLSLKADDVTSISLYPGEYICKFQSIHCPSVKEVMTILLSEGMTSKVYNIQLAKREQQQVGNSRKTVIDVEGTANTYESFRVVLLTAGSAKLQAVKVIKEYLGLGLKEAKDLVDGAPTVIRENLSLFNAQELKQVLDELGCEIMIQSSSSIRQVSDETFDVVLLDSGPSKLQIVKAIKECLGLGLKEARVLVDSAPVVISEKMNYSNAQKLKRMLEELNSEIIIQFSSSIRQWNNATHSVVLIDAGLSKLQVVKAIKEYLGLGLKEAKDLVDTTPCRVGEMVSLSKAHNLKRVFEEIGAKVGIM